MKIIQIIFCHIYNIILIFTLILIPCKIYSITSGDAYITTIGTEWTIGTTNVERIIEFQTVTGKLFTKSYKNKVSGYEFIPAGTTFPEFSYSRARLSTLVTSTDGAFTFIKSVETRLSQNELQLDIVVQKNSIQITKSYVLYPYTSVIREWVSLKNVGRTSIRIFNPSFLHIGVRPGDISTLDFYWMTGADSNFVGTWDIRKEKLSIGQTKQFNSYDRFPGSNGSGGLKLGGSSSYAPWYSLLNTETMEGVFIGWDYFGHWLSRFQAGTNSFISGFLKVEGYNNSLPPNGIITTPKSFTGLFQGDIDNAGNELLNWQYEYMWDYTRENWFPKIRIMGLWEKGTKYYIPKTGWLGGGADYDSLWRKYFRVADLMRYVGGDINHRDWGWWDMAGEWNGPNFGSAGEYLNKYGMSKLIYAFLYQADIRSQVAKQNPGWLIGDVLDMSIPGVVSWIKNKLDTFKTKWGAFEWRNDGWMLKPKNGDTVLLKQDQGMRQILKDFLDKYPDCSFQGVNGGGNCAGYDYIRYGNAQQISDAGVNTYYATLLFPPDKLFNIPEAFNLADSNNPTFRKILRGSLNIHNDTWDLNKLEGLREIIDIYKYLQTKGVVGRWTQIYRPVVIGDDQTMYFQRMSKDKKYGIIITEHRAPGSVIIKPKGLIPTETYNVSFQETDTTQNRSGQDLMDNGISFTQLPDGELIYLNIPYHPGSALDTTLPTGPTNVRKQKGVNMGYAGIEISWNPGTDNNWISYYDIFRNNEWIDKVAKGTYYFDHSAGGYISAKYEIRTVDGAGNVSGKVVAVSTDTTPVAVYDDAQGGFIVYSNSWVSEYVSYPAYRGTISKAKQKGAFAELSFVGKKVVLYTKLGNECGRARISIDGSQVAVIDTYSADEIYGVSMFQNDFGSFGSHIIKIEVLGETTTSTNVYTSTGTYVYIDGIQVEVQQSGGPAQKVIVSANPTSIIADGISETTLTGRIVDSNNTIVLTAAEPITFTLSGIGGTFRGHDSRNNFTNPGFELGNVGSLPTDWSFGYSGMNSTAVKLSTYVKEGSYAAKVRLGATDNFLWFEQPIPNWAGGPHNAGEVWTFDINLRSTTTVSVRFYITERDPLGGTLGSTIDWVNLTGTEGWVKATLQYTIPVSRTSFFLSGINIFNPDNGGKDVWVDAVNLYLSTGPVTTVNTSAGITTVIYRSPTTSGIATITATSPGLTGGTTNINLVESSIKTVSFFDNPVSIIPSPDERINIQTNSTIYAGTNLKINLFFVDRYNKRVTKEISKSIPFTGTNSYGEIITTTTIIILDEKGKEINEYIELPGIYTFKAKEEVKEIISLVDRSKKINIKRQTGYGDISLDILENTIESDVIIEIMKTGNILQPIKNTAIMSKGMYEQNSDNEKIKQETLVQIIAKDTMKADISDIIEFNKPITFTLPYPDKDNDGIIDGTGIKEDSLRIWKMEYGIWKIQNRTENMGGGEIVSSQNIDVQQNKITTMITKLGVYAIIAMSTDPTIENLIVYPNPFNRNTNFAFKIGSGGETKIDIYTLSGRLINTLTREIISGSDPNIKIGYDGVDEHGDELSNGIYIYKLTTKNNDKKHTKINKIIKLK